MSNFCPELLAPAGGIEKLKTAILYGADAVYFGAQKFGLRAAAENFTFQEIEEGIQFAHGHKARGYIVLNGFLHDTDISELKNFLGTLDELNVDGAIISDLGVLSVVKKYSKLPIHLSTQASCLNTQAAKFYRRLGTSRIVLGREVSIKEASKIKKATGLELEMFIHGSMCMAYSGNCVISNYTHGRDSNRGGCSHNCRYQYSLSSTGELESKTVDSYFMSSKDLFGLEQLEAFQEAGIDSLKIEGRMKGPLYLASVCHAYSHALKELKRNRKLSSESLRVWSEQLNAFEHRDYTSGNLIEDAKEDSIYDERETDDGGFNPAGIVMESHKDFGIIVEVRAKFKLNDTLEILPFEGLPFELKVTDLKNLANQVLTETKPGTLVRIPWKPGASRWNLVRVKKLEGFTSSKSFELEEGRF